MGGSKGLFWKFSDRPTETQTHRHTSGLFILEGVPNYIKVTVSCVLSEYCNIRWILKYQYLNIHSWDIIYSLKIISSHTGTFTYGCGYWAELFWSIIPYRPDQSWSNGLLLIKEIFVLCMWAFLMLHSSKGSFLFEKMFLLIFKSEGEGQLILWVVLISVWWLLILFTILLLIRFCK